MIGHRTKKIHMIGIGGAGMSPIAELLVHLGYTVSGSDRQKSAVSVRLESLGVGVQYDHEPSLVKTADIVVYSSAIRETNPERQFAAEHGRTQIRRAELLGDLMRMQTAVCICGTHGKTTTTSLIGTLLKSAGLDPTVLVGGMLRESGTHALVGAGDLMVAEADEFDRSFLAMYPTVAVITNIDADHLDCYRDLDDIKQAFIAFTRKVPFFGDIVACIDDDGVCAILPSVTANVTTCAVDREADYRARTIEFSAGCAAFDVEERGALIGSVRLSIPGMHNVRNALAAIAVGRMFDLDIGVISGSLASFRGVHRRFEVIATLNGISIVDDYAHHPREIQATLDAARKSTAGRVVAVFQPHLFTRTRDFLDDFARVLMAADEVFVTAIYRSREEPIPGVTAAAIVEKMVAGGHTGVAYVEDRDSLPELLKGRLRHGDIVLFMGAGDINESARRLAGVLHG
jgi:UDP-N-acetylmuramate--alanine ligase